MRHGKFNVTQGKNFDVRQHRPLDRHRRRDRSGAAAAHHRQGQRRGHPGRHTASMIKSFADLIAYVSTFMTLKPGDIIVTGTPVKLGPRTDPPRWLKPGDVVEVSCPRTRHAAQRRWSTSLAIRGKSLTRHRRALRLCDRLIMCVLRRASRSSRLRVRDTSRLSPTATMRDGRRSSHATASHRRLTGVSQCSIR